MKSDDPYTPVRIPVDPVATSNRVYYIYSTAVVMLLWASIYIYLQRHYAVTTEFDGVIVGVPANYARRSYEFNAAIIALWFVFSLALVNSLLWATLKIFKR